MSSMETLSGSLAGVPFSCTVDAPDLMAYARLHLAPLLSTSNAGAVAVTATLRWHDGQPPSQRPVSRDELTQMDRVDRDIYASSDRLCWFRVDDLRDLYLRHSLAGWSAACARRLLLSARE